MLLHVKEKRERRLGVKLFLKAERCNSPKCVMVRRPTRPGVHGQKRHSLSDYGRQLQEKQKIQVVYGLNNRQLHNLFKIYSERVLVFLERRLDRVVYYLGFAKSPRIARQLINHGLIRVNDRKVTVPSYQIKIGDIVKIKASSKDSKLFEDLLSRLKQHKPPIWLKIDPNEAIGECLALPNLEDITSLFDINLVGEFYSR